MVLETHYILSARNQFLQYKLLAEKAIAQVPDEKIYWQYNPETNSIATIVKHLSGNMLSRFTDFLTSDGEKSWRNRDAEFENETLTRQALMEKWNEGWSLLIETLHSLSESDLTKDITIRSEKLSAIDAINRQLAHYPYHVGQIVFYAKQLKNSEWNSLSIPKNKSGNYNAEKFAKEKEIKNFTDDELKRLK